MIGINQKALKNLFQDFSRLRLAVVGDIMLDHYVWGKVERISPEAPVPVVDVESESIQPGGAANVAVNVQTLGANAFSVGVIGQDSEGDRLVESFTEHRMDTGGLIRLKERPTSVKTRVIAHNQHVVRADREVRNPLPVSVQDRIMEMLKREWELLDGVILEDYNKGLLTPRLIHRIIRTANEHGKPVYVDPKHQHFFEYRDVTVFKPNRQEVVSQMHLRNELDDDPEEVGGKLQERLNCRVLLVTLGEKGMFLFEKGKPMVRLPTQVKQVHDVSGAGDTVIATLSTAMTAGADARTAASIANFAAGIVCERVGTVPVEGSALIQRIQNAMEFE
ncbi:MAG TPA: D-glycero-beta-D-manno-heptose-7-phosphate kinase [bacterium]|nr:D-glycero-beta-D-manno-heptose-7-phosphate kinase [bacterium]